MKFIILSLLFLLLASCIFCAPKAYCINRSPVDTLDLERFMGRWYEIARYDHRFERDLEQVMTDYTLLPDGTIEVVNRGIDSRTGEEKVAHGSARTTPTTGRLRVSFFLFFYSDYNVLALGPNYEWAVIGSHSPKYLWILSRTEQLSEKSRNEILQQIAQRGYPTAPLIFVNQERD
ncbi:MAG: lipocalin family protein [Alistipes sp.]|nr:lipocalin family protein [Alistipes sp.]